MRRVAAIAGAVLVIGTLGACSHSTGSASGAANAAVPAPAAGGGVTQLDKVANAPAHVDNLPPLTPSKIRLAALTVAVSGAGNVAAKADAADSIATGAGGDVDTDNRVDGAQAHATLRLLVPPERLHDVLDQLGRLGTEVSRSGSTQDVTSQVADVTSRVASAQRAITRLRLLYSRATKVGDVIQIEDQLSTREADLESLQAQQRALAAQTSMATITLNLETRAAAAHSTKRSGFLGGLSRGWHAFTRAAGWLATALGAALPFLLLLALVGAAYRFLRRRAVATAPAADPAAPLT